MTVPSSLTLSLQGSDSQVGTLDDVWFLVVTAQERGDQWSETREAAKQATFHKTDISKKE